MTSKNDRQFTHPNFGTEVRVEVVEVADALDIRVIEKRYFPYAFTTSCNIFPLVIP